MDCKNANWNSRKFISEHSHNIGVYSNWIAEEVHRVFDRCCPDWRNPDHKGGKYAGAPYWLYPIDVINDEVSKLFGDYLSERLRYAAAIQAVHQMYFPSI